MYVVCSGHQAVCLLNICRYRVYKIYKIYKIESGTKAVASSPGWGDHNDKTVFLSYRMVDTTLNLPHTSLPHTSVASDRMNLQISQSFAPAGPCGSSRAVRTAPQPSTPPQPLEACGASLMAMMTAHAIQQRARVNTRALFLKYHDTGTLIYLVSPGR